MIKLTSTSPLSIQLALRFAGQALAQGGTSPFTPQDFMQPFSAQMPKAEGGQAVFQVLPAAHGKAGVFTYSHVRKESVILGEEARRAMARFAVLPA